jgi:hypothetical protein
VKIIAQTNGAYLVEATESELDAISGKRLRTETCVGTYNPLPVGTKFDVSEAWRRMRDLNDRTESLRRAAGTMRGLADVLDSQLEIVEVPA